MKIPFSGSYPVTQRFGETITNPAGHTGIDYALYLGTPVLAAMDGTVSRVAHLSTGYGKHVVLTHRDGLETIYAHLSSLSVQNGQTVLAGEVLGLSGNTGNSTGAHLHFEVRKNGVPTDPEPYLREDEPEGVGSRRVIVPQLYVRSGPGTEYTIVDSLDRGDRISGSVTVETVWLKIGQGRWVAVRYQGKDFCETVEQPA